MIRYFLWFIVFYFIIRFVSRLMHSRAPAISIEELQRRYMTDTNLFVLDIRTAMELRNEFPKIASAYHIPLDQLSGRINELDRYRDKEIAVICRSGNRSRKGAEILRAKGFNAKSVNGGMVAFNRFTR